MPAWRAGKRSVPWPPLSVPVPGRWRPPTSSTTWRIPRPSSRTSLRQGCPPTTWMSASASPWRSSSPTTVRCAAWTTHFVRRWGRHPDADRAEGRALFEAMNCAGCHLHPEAAPRVTAPDLGLTALRVREDWLAGYLADPVTIRPAGPQPGRGGLMPDFRLGPAELTAITGYLLELGEIGAPDAAASRPGPSTPADPPPWEPLALSTFAMQKAETLLRDRWSCLGCHQLGDNGGRIGPRLDGIAHRFAPRVRPRHCPRPGDSGARDDHARLARANRPPRPDRFVSPAARRPVDRQRICRPPSGTASPRHRPRSCDLQGAVRTLPRRPGRGRRVQRPLPAGGTHRAQRFGGHVATARRHPLRRHSCGWLDPGEEPPHACLRRLARRPRNTRTGEPYADAMPLPGSRLVPRWTWCPMSPIPRGLSSARTLGGGLLRSSRSRRCIRGLGAPARMLVFARPNRGRRPGAPDPGRGPFARRGLRRPCGNRG